MNEKSLIDIIKKFEVRKSKRIPVAIGDDCTYLKEENGKYLVLSVDSVTENVHFKLNWMSPYYVGYRAMAAALSDLAAKGASPLISLIDLHVPEYVKEDAVEEIYKGMWALADKFSFSISGGNVSRDSHLSISVTVIGERKGLPPLRSGAKEGDYVYVTGNLGLPLLFVKLMEKGVTSAPYKVKSKFLTPIPRFKIAEKILKRYRISAMMDISDGLGLDASRIAGESGKKILIYEDLVPANKVLKKYVDFPSLFALSSGEEYELLFTSPDYIKMKNVHRIGIVRGRGRSAYLLRRNGEIVNISSFGFDHLKQV